MVTNVIAWSLMLGQALIASIGVTLSVLNLLDAQEDMALATEKENNDLERYMARANRGRELYICVAIVCLLAVSLSIVPSMPVPATFRMVFGRACLVIATISLSMRGIHVLRHRTKLLRNTWKRTIVWVNAKERAPK